MIKKANVILLLLLGPLLALSQSSISKRDTIIYKTVGTTELIMKAIYPPAMDKSKKYPGMVFFFGEGWVDGNISHFEQQANYFANRGIVCFLADYRVLRRHGTSVFECISDAKSAMRYVREHSEELGVDENRIIAAGGSAGGHLAASTALVIGYDDRNDNLAVSPKPNALILFNPVVDLGPGAPENYRKVGEQFKEVSPLHNILTGAPPTIIFLGTRDRLIPTETMNYYSLVMRAVGSRCDLLLYEGQSHGFFNYSKSPEYFRKTLYEADLFLNSLGYLYGQPTINNE